MAARFMMGAMASMKKLEKIYKNWKKKCLVAMSPVERSSFLQEMAIRTQMANIYYQRQDDFPPLSHYNKYLEDVEDMTFALITGKDVPMIEEIIAKYEKENHDQIIHTRDCQACVIAKMEVEEAERKKANEAFVKQISQQRLSGEADVKKTEIVDQRSSKTVRGSVPVERHYGVLTCQHLLKQPFPILAPGKNYLEEYDEEMVKPRVERVGGWDRGLSKKRPFGEAFKCLCQRRKFST